MFQVTLPANLPRIETRGMRAQSRFRQAPELHLMLVYGRFNSNHRGTAAVARAKVT